MLPAVLSLNISFYGLKSPNLRIVSSMFVALTPPQGSVVGQVLFTLCMLVVLYLSILLLLENTAHILLLCR